MFNSKAYIPPTIGDLQGTDFLDSSSYGGRMRKTRQENTKTKYEYKNNLKQNTNTKTILNKIAESFGYNFSGTR